MLNSISWDIQYWLDSSNKENQDKLTACAASRHVEIQESAKPSTADCCKT